MGVWRSEGEGAECYKEGRRQEVGCSRWCEKQGEGVMVLEEGVRGSGDKGEAVEENRRQTMRREDRKEKFALQKRGGDG